MYTLSQKHQLFHPTQQIPEVEKLGKIYNSVLLFHLNEFLIEKNFAPHQS